MDQPEDLKQQYVCELSEYLKETGFVVPACTYDESMQERIVDGLISRGIATDFIECHLAALQASTWIAQSMYPSLSTQVQDFIAMYTVLMTLVEDTSKECLSNAQNFHVRMLRREPQPSKVLEAAENILKDLIDIYGPYSSAMILKATLDFISASAIEADYYGQLPLTKHTPQAPWYIRCRTGIGEAYALFAFPEYLYPERSFWHVIYPLIPDLSRLICFGNDLFSFYKESILSDESWNYICSHARCNNLTILQAIQDTRADAVACLFRLRAALSDNPDMQCHMERLWHEYTAYHLGSARYKLCELDVPASAELSKMVKLPKRCMGSTGISMEKW